MKGLASEFSEGFGKVDLAAIFQPVDQVQGGLVTKHGRPCKLEYVGAWPAVRALKWPVNLTLKGFAAAFAKGSRQAWQAGFAILAERRATSERGFATFAMWRVEGV